MTNDISHKEIMERLRAVEDKVDEIHSSTKSLVEAFSALNGAFTVLGWIGKLAKPLIFIGALIAAFGVLYTELKTGK